MQPSRINNQFKIALNQENHSMRPSKYRKDKCPIFITKLHKILSDSQNPSIITWTQDNNGFLILDLPKFTKEVLPKYFKHGNYNSFVRQLNMYNFSKIRYAVDGVLCDHAYQHELFTRGNQSEYRNIRRKETTVRCHSLISYGRDFGEQDEDEGEEEEEVDIFDKLRDVKEKQEKLQEFCFQLISQNQVLLAQNQQLAHKVKKESKKKEKILEQVFRIVGVSIAQFWDQFCQDTETIEEKTNNFKQIYHMLMNFIDKNDLNEILKTLEFFISPKSKTKIFKVVNSSQQVNFLSNYSEEQIEQFISKTNLILEQGMKANFQAEA